MLQHPHLQANRGTLQHCHRNARLVEQWSEGEDRYVGIVFCILQLTTMIYWFNFNNVLIAFILACLRRRDTIRALLACMHFIDSSVL